MLTSLVPGLYYLFRYSISVSGYSSLTTWHDNSILHWPELMQMAFPLA